MRLLATTAVLCLVVSELALDAKGFLLKKKAKKESKSKSHDHDHHHHMPHDHERHVSHASYHMPDYHHGGEVEIHEMDMAHGNDFMHMIHHHDMHDMHRPMLGMMRPPMMMMGGGGGPQRMPLMAVPMNPMMAQMMMMNMMNRVPMRSMPLMASQPSMMAAAMMMTPPSMARMTGMASELKPVLSKPLEKAENETFSEQGDQDRDESSTNEALNKPISKLSEPMIS